VVVSLSRRARYSPALKTDVQFPLKLSRNSLSGKLTIAYTKSASSTNSRTVPADSPSRCYGVSSPALFTFCVVTHWPHRDTQPDLRKVWQKNKNAFQNGILK
jgi:hypothetical protein